MPRGRSACSQRSTSRKPRARRQPTGRPRASAPRGRVIGGVYVVNTRHKPEPGSKPRKRRTPGFLSPLDTVLRPLSQGVFPARAWGPGDPRHKSQFLGRIVDGSLGWLTDSLHAFPLIGPVVSAPFRVGCNLVRGVEDFSNAVTGRFGLHLFLITLLSCLLPATGYSNCCTPDQVHYCTQNICVHDGGCVICVDEDCWEVVSPIVSCRPNYTGVDPLLADHVDAAVTAIYLCDLLGMQEACGAAIAIGALIAERIPHTHNLTETDCYLITQGEDPTWKGFFAWVSREVKLLPTIIDFLRKLPAALVHAFDNTHIFTLISLVGFALNGKVVKAVCILVIYVEAAAAQENWGTCALTGPVTPCPSFLNMSSTTQIACFSPTRGLVWDMQRFYNVTGVDFNRTYVQLAGLGFWGCVYKTGRAAHKCCTWRKPQCGTCNTDCSSLNKKYTYERCGRVHYLTTWNMTGCDQQCPPLSSQATGYEAEPYTTAPSGTSPQHRLCPAARLAMPWDTDRDHYYTLTLPSGKIFLYKYGQFPENCTHRNWARLPYSPAFWSAYWTIVPPGFYSDKRDLSTGLVTKSADGRYQVFYSGALSFGSPAVTYDLLVMTCLAAVGSRWSLALYALYVHARENLVEATALPTPRNTSEAPTPPTTPTMDPDLIMPNATMSNAKVKVSLGMLLSWRQLAVIGLAKAVGGAFGASAMDFYISNCTNSTLQRRNEPTCNKTLPLLVCLFFFRLCPVAVAGYGTPRVDLLWPILLVLILNRKCALLVMLIGFFGVATAWDGAHVAAIAGSYQPDWVLRAIVFLAAYRAPRIAALVTPNIGWVAFFLMLQPVAAGDLTVGLYCYALMAIWMGVAAGLLPRLQLSLSYLRHRWGMFIDAFHDPRLYFLCTLISPEVARLFASLVIISETTLIIIARLAQHLLAPRSKIHLKNTLDRLAACNNLALRVLGPWIVWAAGERGIFWYKHIDGALKLSLKYTDPYYPLETQVIYCEDAGRRLACGDTIKGHPVYARLGNTVAAGIGALARRWRATIPISLRVRASRGELKTFAISLIGSDTSDLGGQVCLMGTPARYWMGYGYAGRLTTVFHGCKGRSIATENGLKPPLAVDSGADIVQYPLPKGMTCLEPCVCKSTEAYLPTRLGRLIGVCEISGKWINTTPLTLREAKGSSGAPLICKCRGVKGTFKAARTARGAVIGVSIIPIEAPVKEEKPADLVDAPPPVPADGARRIELFVAPTGSGKSTKLPMHYYNLGYKVLVLNPSVATTLNLPNYMKATYGFTPNTYCGDLTDNKGSRLTYSTYGMFLARHDPMDYDVVICDEAHSLDSTTVLGIGAAINAFNDAQRPRLMLMATATPPGCAYVPHENVTEVLLDDEGDFSFHGKKIKLDNYRHGRHLIFQATKKHCEALAGDFRAHGINAVYYYRGCDIGKIPKSGPVVVVATDALMTGYTGSFDSVTDCCLRVQPSLVVDMAPTITVEPQIVPVDVVSKMQRRGRTGRGSPGTYYHVSEGATASGTVPLLNVYEAFDSGIAYFGRSLGEIHTYLDFYKQQPGLPQIPCHLPEVANFFSMVPTPKASSLAKAKSECENFQYLMAAQLDLAHAAGSGPPNDELFWRGLKGKEKFPLMYRIFPVDDLRCTDCDTAARLASAFEEVYTSGFATLAAFGAAVAGVYLAVDMFGAVVVMKTWQLVEDSTAAWLGMPNDPPGEALEECAGEWLQHVVGLGEQWFKSAQSWLANAFAKKAFNISDFSMHLLAGIQYIAGLLVVQEAPTVGASLGYVGGLLSPLPLSANLFITTLGAALAAKLSSQRPAMLFGLASAAGALAGAYGLGAALGDIFRCYASSSSTALVVLKLLDGRMPSLGEWGQLAFALSSPGSAVVGAAAAAVVAFATRSESTAWMNRLLAILNKGTTCDDFFLRADTLRQTVIAMLEKASLWHVANQVANYINRADEELCSPRGWWEEVLAAMGRFMHTLAEMARGILNRTVRLPAMPIYACEKTYTGKWMGSGVITSRCTCGADNVWQLDNGTARPVKVARTCRAWWSGGVCINNTLMCTARPLLTEWKTLALNTGWGKYVVYEKKGGEVWIVGVSEPGQAVPTDYPTVDAAVAIDGVQVKSLGGAGWRNCCPYQAKIGHSPFLRVNLPYKLDPPTGPGTLPRLDNPVAEISKKMETLKQVQQTERSLSRDFVLPSPGSSLIGLKKPRMPATRSLDGFSPDAEEATTSHALQAELRLRKPAAAAPAPPESVKEAMPEPPPPPEVPPPEPSQDLSPTVVADVPKAEQDKPAPGRKAKKKTKHLGVKMIKVVPRVVRGRDTGTDWDKKSLLSSSWESVEEDCSVSYVWSAASKAYQTVRRTFSAVSTYTSGLLTNRNLAYSTDTTTIAPRAAKVTIMRTRRPFKEYHDVCTELIAKARTLRFPEWSLDEALAHLSNKTAKSGVTGCTAATIKAGATKVVMEVYTGLETGQLPEPWNQVNIMPKQEVFAIRAAKPTEKAARLIAYPHLETRIVEKMVLGEIAPGVAKGLLGPAYGFQYTPSQRVERLLSMWNGTRKPMGFTCDTVCFDSTITPEDVVVENELYCAAAPSPLTKVRIKTLSDKLYAGGPMLLQGKYAGQRQCRASGVYTTSSSNTITCYIKVTAAARKAGIKNPTWLICGDDVVCICESQGMAADREQLQLFAAYMKELGAPQGEVPVPAYSLERLTSCSSNVSVGHANGRLYHYLTRDPAIPLARASAEGKRFNPLGTTLGYIISNYPALWVSRLLAVQFVLNILSQDTVEAIEFDWYGNNYTLPVKSIPYVVEKLHGRDCWSIDMYTPFEVNRVGRVLTEMTIKPMRAWKRLGRSVYAQAMRRGGTAKFLAQTLLCWVTKKAPRLDPNKVKSVEFNPFDPYAEFEEPVRRDYTWMVIIALLLVGLIALV
ncbi:polyprotein [Possum hepacivrus]|nr:polyprotein [Possum hepacivrus]